MAQTIEGMSKVTANFERHLIFFESASYSYNYKTQQWTSIPIYSTYSTYTVNSASVDLGLAVYSAGSVDLQDQVPNTDRTQTVTITTGSPNINIGGRAVVTGVRPIANGGTYSIRVGTLDDIDGTISWSSATAVNARSNMANFRAEGRYHRAELTITGDLLTVMGADVDYTPQGKV